MSDPQTLRTHGDLGRSHHLCLELGLLARDGPPWPLGALLVPGSADIWAEGGLSMGIKSKGSCILRAEKSPCSIWLQPACQVDPAGVY